MKVAARQRRNEAALVALGERVRSLRAQRGMTRKAAALLAGISERYLANLEYGVGNASILLLQQVAEALQCSVAELIGDMTTSSPEWLLLRDLLADCDEVALLRVRIAAAEILGVGGTDASRKSRVALIGLRGAGKSTLGSMLADELKYPFIELSREIESLAGCNIGAIQALYGLNGYQRYERRALDEALQTYSQTVLAVPGGIVSDPGAFTLLLAHCTTIWLQADPEDHMMRVAAQGDMRPMADSEEAMMDLKRILAGRAAFYSKADYRLNTSGQSLQATFRKLRNLVCEALPNGSGT